MHRWNNGTPILTVVLCAAGLGFNNEGAVGWKGGVDTEPCEVRGGDGASLVGGGLRSSNNNGRVSLETKPERAGKAENPVQRTPPAKLGCQIALETP